MKIQEKEKSRLMRKQGKSIKEIAKELNVSKGSVSVWVRDIQLTQEQINLLKNKNFLLGATKKREIYKDKRLKFQSYGSNRILANDKDFERVCLLYWAEGAKNKNSLKISNSDVNFMKFFISSLRKCFKIKTEEITLTCSFYTNCVEDFTLIPKYWIKELDLNESCLRKCQINKQPTSSSGKKKGKLKYGTCYITVNRTDIVQEVFGGIQEISGHIQLNWLD